MNVSGMVNAYRQFPIIDASGVKQNVRVRRITVGESGQIESLVNEVPDGQMALWKRQVKATIEAFGGGPDAIKIARETHPQPTVAYVEFGSDGFGDRLASPRNAVALTHFCLSSGGSKFEIDDIWALVTNEANSYMIEQAITFYLSGDTPNPVASIPGIEAISTGSDGVKK